MLLTESELGALPELLSQENEDDPIIHIKLEDPARTWACYIAEGGRKDMYYEVFALFVGKYGYNWGQLPLPSIEADLQRSGINAAADHNFTPQRSSTLTGLKRRGNLRSQ